MNNKELLYKKLKMLRYEIDGSIVDDIITTVDVIFLEQNSGNTNVLRSLPSIDDAGAVAVVISENIKPILTAQEQSLFIAGFQECIKWMVRQ